MWTWPEEDKSEQGGESASRAEERDPDGARGGGSAGAELARKFALSSPITASRARGSAAPVCISLELHTRPPALAPPRDEGAPAPRPRGVIASFLISSAFPPQLHHHHHRARLRSPAPTSPPPFLAHRAPRHGAPTRALPRLVPGSPSRPRPRPPRQQRRRAHRRPRDPRLAREPLKAHWAAPADRTTTAAHRARPGPDARGATSGRRRRRAARDAGDAHGQRGGRA